MNKYHFEELNLHQKNIIRYNPYFIQDMNTFVNYLFTKGGIKTNNKLITLTHIKELEPDFIYPMETKRKRKETNIPYMFSMDFLLRIAGLTEVIAGVLISKSAILDNLKDKTDEEKIKYIYQSYLNNRLITETSYIKRLNILWKDQKKVSEIMINFRKALNSALSECKKDYWYSINELTDIIPTDDLLSNIDTAKYGSIWLIYNGEEYNSRLIPLMICSYILDTFLRYMGINSIYIDDDNRFEELGIRIKFPTMFEYKGF
jgi:hypothetical protein